MEKLNNSQLNRLFSNRYFNYTLFVLAGLFLGWLIFRDGDGLRSTLEWPRELARLIPC